MNNIIDKPRVRASAQIGQETPGTDASQAMEMFSFGDPEPVNNIRDFFYQGLWLSADQWYEPPIPLSILAKTYRATAHHGSALQFKRNLLARTFIPHPLLSDAVFRALCLDYMVFGNAYLEEVRGRLGKLLPFRLLRAKYTRRGEGNRYWWVPDFINRVELPKGRVIHVMEPDIDQDIYGTPDYLGSLQSAWLNESATLFRRRYYLNGSHAGFILYVNDAAQDATDIDKMREALKNAKGPGNFRNLFLYSPNGKKDGVQVIPVSEVAAKDEFLNIKNVTRDDQLAGHRIPPQLLGIIPTNAGGFGDVVKATEVFVANEIVPLQHAMLSINEHVGEEVVKFQPYSITAGGGVVLDPAK